MVLLPDSPPPHPDEIRLRDVMKVEECIGSHMLYLMLEQASKKEQIVIRADMLHKLNLAACVPLSKLDELTVSRIAQRVDEVATTLLRDASRLDYADGAAQAAMFNMILIDEGYLVDARAIGVLVSMMVIEDLKSPEPDATGASPVANINREPLWKGAARDMLLRAQTMGLYSERTRQLRRIQFEREQPANLNTARPRRDNAGFFRDKTGRR